MASIRQIRGALLEEIVLFLLERSGYRRVLVGEEGTHNGPAGLEVEGRGSPHQIDALVTPLHSHAFVYPIHLISRREIPMRFIREQGEIRCEIRVSDDDQTWAFEPSGIPEDSPDFFHLEFTIPEFVADMLNSRTGPEAEGIPRWQQIAEVKRRYLRFIDVTAVLDGQLIMFRLTLDVDWLNRYVQRREALAPRGGEVA